MNIFATSVMPHHCVQALDDLRLRKMSIESAQLLCTYLHITQHDNYDIPMLPTHNNHPCSKWLRQKQCNVSWLYEYLYKSCTEQLYRFGSFPDVLSDVLQCVHSYCELSKVNYATMSFANCTPHKQLSWHDAYRLTLCEKWQLDLSAPKWTKRNVPWFYVEHIKASIRSYRHA